MLLFDWLAVQVLVWARQLLQGLNALHSQAHLPAFMVSPHSVVLCGIGQASLKAKLAPFSLAPQGMAEGEASSGWQAPEAAAAAAAAGGAAPMTEASSVFSFGRTMLDILAGCSQPGNAAGPSTSSGRAAAPQVPSRGSPELMDPSGPAWALAALLKHVLEVRRTQDPRPASRCSIEQLLQDPLFSHDWSQPDPSEKALVAWVRNVADLYRYNK